MQWINREIGELPRQGNFPFRVKMLYCCRNEPFRNHSSITPDDTFEVNIRLDSSEWECRDIINGHEIKARFPHVVWKHPGKQQAQMADNKRDTIAFAYSSRTMKFFRALGLLSEQSALEFTLTPKIEGLILELRKSISLLYTPGMVERIDWLCFQLYGELFFAQPAGLKNEQKAELIKNISVWFQLHHTENFNLDDVARSHGLSHTMFFNEWKRHFNVSPVQYIIDLKLYSASNLLMGTALPIAEIVRKINFSSPTAFYKRFFLKYGVSPGDFRKIFSGRQQYFFHDVNEPVKLVEEYLASRTKA